MGGSTPRRTPAWSPVPSLVWRVELRNDQFAKESVGLLDLSLAAAERVQVLGPPGSAQETVETQEGFGEVVASLGVSQVAFGLMPQSGRLVHVNAHLSS